MKKIETIWHFLLLSALTDGKYKQTQQELAGRFRYSLSTVNHALKIPCEIGAVRKMSKFFVLHDCRKLLYYWASVRNLNRDILYSAGSSLSVREREGLAVPGSVFGAYTAAAHLLGEPPADYAKVYFYLAAEGLTSFKQRFPRTKARVSANVFALKMPETLPGYGPYTTAVQTYVDLWNLPDWYARDFLQALEKKIRVLLS